MIGYQGRNYYLVSPIKDVLASLVFKGDGSRVISTPTRHVAAAVKGGS